MKTFVSTTLIMLLALHTGIRAQWSSDPSENTPVTVASGEQAIPKVATSENGITYISWFSNETGNYNVRLQKLDTDGTFLWEEDGILVSDNPSMTWLTDWDMAVDQEDCAILTFQDIRNVDNDVFAYRISPEGEFLWGEDGIEMSTGPAFDAAPKTCVTASGNAVFAWQADEVVILQKISPDGDKLWGDDGITISGDNTYSWPQLLPVGEDDVILKFFEDSGPVWAPTRHVYARRYDADGNPVWENDAVISEAGGISAWTQVFPIINDGEDGFYIAWHDDRDNDMNASVFVQHISVDGEVLLDDDGTEASTQPNRENFYPFLALPEGSEDIFVFWNEMDADQNNRGIYGQKISSGGDRLWTDNGKVFIEISSTNVYPFSAGTSLSGMTIFYEKYFNAVDAEIHAMCIDTVGDWVWPQEMVTMCSVQSEKVHPVTGLFMQGQWISAWEDDRNGNRDIYAQNIKIDGALGPVIPGEVEVSPDTLFFEENPQTLEVHVVNKTLDPYIVTGIDETGTFYLVTPYPELPYTIPPADSLVIDVYYEFITSSKQTGDYAYEDLNITSETDTTTVVVAVNEDLLTAVSETWPGNPAVFPNPASSQVVFFFEKEPGENNTLTITDLSGRIVRTFLISRQKKVTWDCRDENGELLPPGLYLYRHSFGNGSVIGKIALIR